MKKTALFTVLLFSCLGASIAQTRAIQVTLFGGASHTFAYGSADDYAMGGNDFPVTPAHSPGAFGAAFAYYFSDRLGVELRGEYTLASTMTLTDPSDLDTVSISSAKHYSGSLNLVWEPVGGRIRPYFVLGGGADKLSGSTQTAVSQYGYEVAFAPPVKTLGFFAAAGVGLRVALSSAMGVQIDLRYKLLFADPDKIPALNAAAGVYLRF